MEKAADIQKHIRDLFRSQNLAVLATQNNDQPYASLIAFAATENYP
jgi:hypothetical protein